MTVSVAPPGWPDTVRPPGAPGWDVTRGPYLFDCCPADFRGYRVLRHHPVVLARFAKHFVEGQCRATQDGIAAVRTALKGQVRREVIDTAAEAWLAQSAELVRTRRAVALVEEALRGRVFVARL